PGSQPELEELADLLRVVHHEEAGGSGGGGRRLGGTRGRVQPSQRLARGAAELGEPRLEPRRQRVRPVEEPPALGRDLLEERAKREIPTAARVVFRAGHLVPL